MFCHYYLNPIYLTFAIFRILAEADRNCVLYVDIAPSSQVGALKMIELHYTTLNYNRYIQEHSISLENSGHAIVKLLSDCGCHFLLPDSVPLGNKDTR